MSVLHSLSFLLNLTFPIVGQALLFRCLLLLMLLQANGIFEQVGVGFFLDLFFSLGNRPSKYRNRDRFASYFFDFFDTLPDE